MPAPGYETPEEIRAALATVVVDSPGSESITVRPGADSKAESPPHPPQAEFAMLQPRPADSVIAVPAAFSSNDIPAAAGLTAAPDRALREAVELARVPSPASLSIAEPAAHPEAVAPHMAALDQVVVPDAPAPLRSRADETSEQTLALARAERIRIQRRLALAGFDPRGFDGVFGPRTREAIAAYQVASGFPSTGYLDAGVLADLRTRTEDAYAALLARAERKSGAAPKQAPVAEARRVASAEQAGGCARDADGRILARQSFVCDVKGLAEKVTSLGRDKLPHEEGGSMTLYGPSAFGATPDSRR